MAKKVNMFSANKDLSTRVEDFMKKTVWGGVLRTRLQKEIADTETAMANVENLRGSILDLDGGVDKMIAQYAGKLAEVKKKYADQIEAEAKFAYTEADNDFFAEYKKGNVSEAVIKWARSYGLDMTDTDFLGEVVDAISGRKAASFKKIVKSEGKEFTTNRTKQDVLKVLYGTFADKMVAAGTLKPAQIPEDVRKFYESKKSKKN